jgi:pilus assembly protein Flp/PilA
MLLRRDRQGSHSINEIGAMCVMIRIIRRLLYSRSGATAIEYGLIAALIAVVTISGLTKLGTT